MRERRLNEYVYNDMKMKVNKNNQWIRGIEKSREE